MKHEPAIFTFRAAATFGLLPPPELTISQWADKYRVLSREDSNAAGPWRTDARPFQRAIMDAITDPLIVRVTVEGPAQWGKTQVLNNIVGGVSHLDPGPIMVVQPTIAMAEKWSKTRLAPMLRDTPVLQGLFSEVKSRNAQNTILEKTFPGGILVVVGSNAPAGLASQPVRVLCLDEVDRFEESAGTEGDPVDLAEARTLDFIGRRKIYACSTPLLEDTSRIHKNLRQSDWRRLEITCPKCQKGQFLEWTRVTWTPGEPATARYLCTHCKHPMTQPELSRATHQAALDDRWIPTQPWIKDHAGFQLHGLQVRSMEFMVEELEKATKKGIRSIQVWWNTVLGLPWSTRMGDSITKDALLGRRRPVLEVPSSVGIITLAVDVQDTRLEALVVGWGVGEERWVLEHREISGNLAEKEPWDQLEQLVRRSYDREDGGRMRASLCVVDLGGHFGKQVYRFAKRPGVRGLVRVVKGNTRPQVSPVVRSKTRGGLLWLVDTVALKDEFFSALKVEQEGPGFIHFGDKLGEAFFEQLLAEQPATKNGARCYKLKKKGMRNEGLDLMVYAAAALEIYAPQDLRQVVEATQKAANRPRREKGHKPAPAPEPAPGDPVVSGIRRIGAHQAQVLQARASPRKGGGMSGV